jgi:tetratricopeptide (TPR) repeat protein
MGWRARHPFPFFSIAGANSSPTVPMPLRLLPSVVLAALVATPCWAQGLRPLALSDPIAQSDSLYFGGQPQASFEVLRAHLAHEPDDYEALWRTARACLIMGSEGEGWRIQNSWFDTGMEFGNRAVEVRPDGVDGRYWRAAVTGRRALNAAPQYGAKLGEIAYEDAYAILAVDPDHGGAHNILGKMFFEIMSMSRIQRFLGRTFVHTDALRESSWEAAEEHLEAAAADWPDSMLFQYDLAELYRKRGRKDEARAVYARVSHMPVVHPSDATLRRDAVQALEEMGS